MPFTYTWRCHICDRPNAGDVDSCVHCNFPAIASGKQVENEKLRLSKLNNPNTNDANVPEPSIGAVLTPLNAPRRLAFLLGLAICITGAFWLKGTASLRGTAISAIVTIVGLLLMRAAYIDPNPLHHKSENGRA